METYNIKLLKKKAKMVWKRFKACGFDESLLKKRFEVVDEDISLYNKYYGWRFGMIKR